MLATAPSKVPFYIAGGVLVAWAVLVAAWGITHADFPGALGRARLVMLTTIVLVAATMTSAVATGGEAEPKAAQLPAAPAPTGRTFAVAANPSGALQFDKTRAAVQSGRVSVDFTNASSIAHNVTIAQGTKTLGATNTITSSKATISLDLAPGDYVYFCSVPGHRQAGMQGTLTVR